MFPIPNPFISTPTLIVRNFFKFRFLTHLDSYTNVPHDSAIMTKLCVIFICQSDVAHQQVWQVHTQSQEKLQGFNITHHTMFMSMFMFTSRISGLLFLITYKTGVFITQSPHQIQNLQKDWKKYFHEKHSPIMFYLHLWKTYVVQCRIEQNITKCTFTWK